MSTAPLRQELEDLIRRDLLGPAGGERETITEQRGPLEASRSSSPTSKKKAVRATCTGCFQAELAVRGLFARRPGQGHVSALDAVSRLEDQTNEMLYRRDVEFARGHGACVEWELAEGRMDHAVCIHTAAMPRAVVRTVEQCDVPRLITDMHELAEAPDDDLAGKLAGEWAVHALDLRGRRVRRRERLWASGVQVV